MVKKGGNLNIPYNNPNSSGLIQYLTGNNNINNNYKSHIGDYVNEVNKYESSAFMIGGSTDPKSINIHKLENYYSSPLNDTQFLDIEKNYTPVFDNANFESSRALSNFGISKGGNSSNEFKVIKDLLDIIIKLSWNNFKNKKKGGDGDVKNYIQYDDYLKNDITNLGIKPYEYPKPYAKIT